MFENNNLMQFVCKKDAKKAVIIWRTPKKHLFFALDLELNQPSGKIIQVGIAMGKVNQAADEYILRKWYIDPDEPISSEIENLTGISDADIKDLAVPHAVVAAELSALLQQHDCFINPVTWGGGDSVELLAEFRDGEASACHQVTGQDGTLTKGSIFMTTRKYNPDFNNHYQNDEAVLRVDGPQRAGGKKVFEWKFFVRGSDKKMQVDVYLDSDKDGLKFRAECDRLPSPVHHTDINTLRTQVERELTEQASSISGIVWEDWFEVVVSGSNSDFEDSRHSALGADLKIQVNRLKRGIHPLSGFPLTINCNGVVVDFPTATSISETEQGGIRFYPHPVERSYIPATPENRQAIDDILSRMDLLRANLASMLSQDVIQTKLAGMDNMFQALPNFEGS